MGDIIVLGVIIVICILAIYSIKKSKKDACNGGCANCGKACSSDIYAKYNGDQK